jgi:hypothetical protein
MGAAATQHLSLNLPRLKGATEVARAFQRVLFVEKHVSAFTRSKARATSKSSLPDSTRIDAALVTGENQFSSQMYLYGWL